MSNGLNPLDQVREALEAADRAKAIYQFDRLQGYVPYPWQKVLHRRLDREGKPTKQTMLMGGNQTGKCLSIQTLIDHPDGSSTPVGILWTESKAFKVLSWDGEKLVQGLATGAIKKAPEMVYRVELASGAWFECAANHRILMASGEWRLVSSLPAFSVCRLLSTWERARSILREDVPRWSGRLQGFLARCFAGFRLYDARLRSASNTGLASSPSQGGVPQRVCFSLPGDAPGSTRTNIALKESGHLSSRGADFHYADRYVGNQDSAAVPTALPTFQKLLDALQQSTVAAFRFRSISAVLLRVFGSSWALLSPDELAVNKIVAIYPIGVQEIYDFTVMPHSNYLAGGVIHHNTQFGGADVAIHMTGRYPAWWEGPRFSSAIRVLGGGVSTTSVRDILQLKLLGGDPENAEVFGTGLVPLECLLDKKGKPMTERWVGNPGGVQKFYVRHVSGGLSQCDLKSYEQGPGLWMGVQADLVWGDEEPPRAIYSQMLRATIATGGYINLTMTPENGATDIVREFMTQLKAGQLFVQVGWNDAPHLTEEVKAQLLLAYPVHERDMRSKGIPMLGQGLVFPFPWDLVSCPSFPIPNHWLRIAAMDFGSGGHAHATAAGWVAFDLETKSAYGYDAYKGHGSASQHAAAIKGRGERIPIAWPHDGNRADGYMTGAIAESLATIYRNSPLSLNLLPEHFHNPGSTDIAVETGITAMSLAMEGGRFKWFNHLSAVRQEYEMFHRKDGKIVKKEDDLMSAFRYAYQSRDQAWNPMRDTDSQLPVFASGVDDYDPRFA